MSGHPRYQPMHEEEHVVAQSNCFGNDGGGFAPSESMDLQNDPRFFNDNVIDKRLTAFTALSVVSSITAGCAVDQFGPFWEEADQNMFGTAGFASQPFRIIVYLVGFGLMCLVLFLNTVATMTFGIQFYFMYRLVTSGPLGFEAARAFYLNPTMTYWRQFAVKALIFGLPMFMCAIGCMLFVRYVNRNPERHIIAWITLCIFCTFAIILLRVGYVHQHVFNQKYYTGANVRPLLTEIETSNGSHSRGRVRY